MIKDIHNSRVVSSLNIIEIAFGVGTYHKLHPGLGNIEGKKQFLRIIVSTCI